MRNSAFFLSLFFYLQEREISQGRSERDFLEADKHKLEAALQQQEL